ncbi:MAG: peptidyl-prolyl cis-trans isomerase [Thermoanaerobaculia bacterium]
MPAGGCRRRLATSADVAVTIDGEEIHYLQFESYLRDQTDWHGQPGPDTSFDTGVQSRIFDQFIDGQLLIRLAIERGMSYDRAVRDQGTTAAEPFGEPGAAERTAITLLLRDRIQQAWDDDVTAAYYEAHQTEFQQPEQVHLRQILVEERSRAAAAQHALARGEDFAEVAARFSQGPKAHLGGDQGLLAREDLPADFRPAIFALEAGEVSDIVSAYYGFLIFQVVERFDAQTQPLPEVADEIRQTLARRHLDELAEELLQEARGRYTVKVFPDNFPFEYQGAYAK